MHRVGLLLTLLFAGCGGDAPVTPPGDDPGKPVLLTTFYPLTYVAERIAGDLAEVSCPLPANQDPIFWQPDTAAIQAYQAADLIIVNGAGFEQWLATTVLPATRVVETSRAFSDRWLRYEDAVVHTHGPGKEHLHEGVDGHTWLDPLLARQQAEAILAALVERLPEAQATLQANFDALAADLAELDAGLEALTLPEPIYAEHPAYNYLAARYGWKIEHVDIEQPPADRTGLLLWESEPSVTIPGLRNLVFSPCETRPESGDYLSVMQANIQRLKSD